MGIEIKDIVSNLNIYEDPYDLYRVNGETNFYNTYWKPFLTQLVALPYWKDKSTFVEPTLSSYPCRTCYTKCYFSEHYYLKIFYESSNLSTSSYGKFAVDVYSDEGDTDVKLDTIYRSSKIGSGDTKYISLSIAATSKGVAFRMRVGNSSFSSSPFDTNFYVTETNNQKTALVSLAESGALVTWIDGKISTEPALGTTISADRKAVLVPVANTATGEVFKDIFVMRYSPIQYGTMEIEGKGVYLCGKTLCLKDSEEV